MTIAVLRLAVCVASDAVLTAVSLGMYPFIANAEGCGTLTQKELQHQREMEVIEKLLGKD